MLTSAGRTIWVATAALACCALSFAAGCDRSGPRAAARGEARRAAANESAYHAPPTVRDVVYDHGRIVLSGAAQPGVAVRLATPDRRVVSVTSSREGAWRIVLPSSPDMRLFSLSMIDGGRVVQSEGYLAAAPDVVAELRSGAGAMIMGQARGEPRLAAVDYDSKGGGVVSGVASPGRSAAIQVDGVERGGVRADAAGHFSLALDEPLSTGSHTITLTADGGRSEVAFAVAPPGPMPAIPLIAARTRLGWRVDWTTPGGGLQTTLLFASPET